MSNWSLEPGGAVSGESANIFVHGNNFINNTSGASGGAIHFFLSSVEISDCLFKNNLATIEGGAISASMTDSLVVYNCSFRDNFANMSGGAISSESVMEISNCLFENNSAGYSGGAIFVTNELDGLYHKTSVTNSSFASNKAVDGGAVHCKKTDSKSGPFIFSQSHSDSNFALNGGVLYSTGCSISLYSNMDISNNHAENGGAIYTEDSFLEIGELDSFHVATVKLTKNSAMNGGALFLTASNLNFYNGTVILNHNVATSKGGALYISDKKCEVPSEFTSCFLHFHEKYEAMFFLNNYARRGSVLYGGLLDRCLDDDTKTAGIDFR